MKDWNKLILPVILFGTFAILASCQSPSGTHSKELESADLIKCAAVKEMFQPTEVKPADYDAAGETAQTFIAGMTAAWLELNCDG